MAKKWEDLTLLPTDRKELFNILFEAFFGKLVDFIDDKIHDIFAAEIITSRLFEHVWLNMEFKTKKHAEDYLYKAARSRIINYWRNNRQYLDSIDDEGHDYLSAPPSDSPDHMLDVKLLEDSLDQILPQLSEQGRKVVMLRRNHLTEEDIAGILKIKPNTVYRHLRNALAHVKEALNRQGWGPLLLLVISQHKIF